MNNTTFPIVIPTAAQRFPLSVLGTASPNTPVRTGSSTSAKHHEEIFHDQPSDCGASVTRIDHVAILERAQQYDRACD